MDIPHNNRLHNLIRFMYGMKARGFSPGAQPLGVIEWMDSDKTKTGYWSVITYGRELTDKEIEDYDLEPID